jgi:hypothetical protein
MQCREREALIERYPDNRRRRERRIRGGECANSKE